MKQKKASQSKKNQENPGRQNQETYEDLEQLQIKAALMRNYRGPKVAKH